MNATALAPSSSMTPSRSTLVTVLLPLTYALFGFAWMSFVPLMPEITAALKVQRADGTLLITIISMAKSFAPILAGVLAAKLGLTRTMRLAAVLMIVGAAAPWLDDRAAMVAVRFVFGVGGAMWVTLMGSVVLAAVAPERRPFANSLNAIAVNVGVVAALFFTLPLAQTVGTRPALSAACVAVALCFVVLLALGDLGGAAKPMPVVDTLRAYGKTLAVPTTWILALAFCGPLALYLVLNTFLGTHLEAQFAIPRAESMRWLSFMNLWGVPASLGAGLMLARVHAGPRPYLVVAALLVPAAVAGAVLVDDGAARALCFALAGFGLFLPTAPLVTAVQKLPGQTPEKLAMVFGTMFAVTYLASAAVPTLVGSLVANGVPLASALVGAAVLGASPLVGLALPRGD